MKRKKKETAVNKNKFPALERFYSSRQKTINKQNEYMIC